MSILSAIASSRKRSVSKVYKTIPVPPVFSDSHTITQGATGNGIQSGDTNGKTELLIGGNYTFMQLNGLSGLYKIKSLDETDPSTWAQIGSGAGNDYSITAAVSTPSVEYYNVRLIDSDNIVKMPGDVVGKTQLYQNVILEDGVFGGFLINENAAGDEYGDITFIFCRVLRSGGESWYIGRTGASQQFFRGITTVTNCYSEDSGREALQFNGHADVRVTNFTAYNGGLDTGSGIGQNNCFQLQNVFTGYFKKCIFWNFRAPAMIACQDFLFEDCFFGWTEPDRAIFFQDMSANGYTEFENNGGTVRFRGCTFYNPFLIIDYVVHVQEEQCNLIFEDCIFPSVATSVYDDQRSSTPYALTVTGSSFTDTPDLPGTGSPPEAEYIGFERVITDDPWYNRHVGFRSNPNDL